MSDNFVPYEIPLEQLQNQDFWDDEEFINDCMEAEAESQATEFQNAESKFPQNEERSDELHVPEFLCPDPNLPFILDRLRLIKAQAEKSIENEKLRYSMAAMAKSWFECGLESSKYLKI